MTAQIIATRRRRRNPVPSGGGNYDLEAAAYRFKPLRPQKNSIASLIAVGSSKGGFVHEGLSHRARLATSCCSIPSATISPRWTFTTCGGRAATISAWKYQQEGRNLVGKGRAMIVAHDTYDALESDFNAMRLFLRLQRVNWHRQEFALANAMHMGLCAFRAAIACVHERGSGPHDPPIYSWTKMRR